MASARFPGSHPEVTGKTWTLVITECPDGRLAIYGLPEGRLERLSLAARLRDLLLAVQHADAPGQTDALLWRKYCRAQFAAFAAEFPATVEFVPPGGSWPGTTAEPRSWKCPR